MHRLQRPYRVECPRCGEAQLVERGGAFRDSDYYELHREYQELQMCISRLLKLICGMPI